MRDETLRVKVAQLNKLVNMAGELVLGRNQLLRAAESLSKSTPGLGTIVKRLGIVISDLQEQIMNTRMQPISTVFGKFPRVVRDLEKIVGKKIELTMEGNEIELDKSIIEALADPLTHLVRNVADHGLENEAERLKNDKPPHGNVCLKAFHESGHVIVEVSDDGRGVDGNKVGVKALEKGLVTPQHLAAISEHEKIQMIFLPGFSTKDAASSLSGRGVGMDVVKTNIEKLGGTVDIQSTVGKGTTVRMTLPLTLAIVSSLIFRLKERSFIIPQVNIDEMVSIEPSEINNKIGWVQNQNVLKLRGRLMPLVRLAEILGCHDRFTDIMDENELRAGFSLLKLYKQAGFNGSVRIIVVRIGNSELGLIVDEISGIEEIVVKPIPEYLKSLGWYSGCTILGSGQVALIIDVLEIMKQQQISLSENITGTETNEEVNDKGRNVYLLTFSNGTEEKFALPIPDILRIDHYEAEKIQRIGRREFIEHQGKVMHLLRLEEHLNIQQPENRQEDSSACLVVLKNSEPLCCIYTHKILDSKYVRIKVEENNTYGKAVKGTVLVDNKLHMLLETDGLIDCARKSGS
jgi:two-component system chemotaxis sensor kinase CheA